MAKVDAPPGKQLVRCSPTWQGGRSPAAATPPKAPATVPRPAPTCRQQGWKWLQSLQKDQQHLKAWQRAVWRVEDQAFNRSPTQHHSGHSTLGFHSLTLSWLLINLLTFGPSSLRQVRNSTGINVRLVLSSTTSPLSRSSASHGRAASLPPASPSSISPISSFPQPCALQQTSPTTADELDKLAFFNKGDLQTCSMRMEGDKQDRQTHRRTDGWRDRRI